MDLVFDICKFKPKGRLVMVNWKMYYPNEIVAQGDNGESLSSTQSFCKKWHFMVMDEIRIYNVSSDSRSVHTHK